MFVFIALISTLSYAAPDLTAKDCARLLHDFGVTHRDDLAPVADLGAALAGQTEATILLRHHYARSRPKFYAPLTLVTGRRDLFSELLFVQNERDAFAVLHGATARLLAATRDLVARYGTDDLFARVLGGAPRPPRWTKGKTMVQLDDARADVWLDELAALDVDAATIYDADHDTGLFAYSNAQFGDPAEAHALGIEEATSFDRATFTAGPKLWRAGRFVIVSRAAYERLIARDQALAQNPGLSIPEDLQRAIAAGFPVTASPPVVAPLAPAAVAPPVSAAPASLIEPDWILALGPDADAKDIVAAINAHDPEPLTREHKNYNVPGYALKRFTELWALYRHGQEMGVIDLRRMDACGAYHRINKRAKLEIEKEWRRFVEARPTPPVAPPVAPPPPAAVAAPKEPAPTEPSEPAPARIQSEALGAVRAFLTRAAKTNEFNAGALKDIVTRALLAVELEIPDARLSTALAAIEALELGATWEPSQLHFAWSTLATALGLETPRDLARADVEKLVRHYDHTLVDQNARVLKPIERIPTLEVSVAAHSDAVRLNISQHQLKGMLRSWNGWILQGKGKASWTLLYGRPGVMEPDADYVTPYIAIIEKNRVTRIEDRSAGILRFYVGLSYLAGQKDLDLAPRFTPLPVKVGRDVQAELFLERGLDLHLIARVLRRGEVVASRGTLDFVLRDPEGGRQFDVGLNLNADAGVYYLHSFKAQR